MACPIPPPPPDFLARVVQRQAAHIQLKQAVLAEAHTRLSIYADFGTGLRPEDCAASSACWPSSTRPSCPHRGRRKSHAWDGRQISPIRKTFLAALEAAVAQFPFATQKLTRPTLAPFVRTPVGSHLSEAGLADNLENFHVSWKMFKADYKNY